MPVFGPFYLVHSLGKECRCFLDPSIFFAANVHLTWANKADKPVVSMSWKTGNHKVPWLSFILKLISA